MQIEFDASVDCVADFTYNFYWQHRGAKLNPDEAMPAQVGSDYTFRDVVETLKRGEDVHIRGDVGHRLCSSMGVDLKFFSGTGRSITAGTVTVDGNVDTRLGISMVAGAIYVSGAVKAPVGNVIEVHSDRKRYKKFRSITDVVCNGLKNDSLAHPNIITDRELHLRDGIVRDTIGARCDCNARINVDGDVALSTGILMRAGEVVVTGNAGMNSGALLQGGTVVIKGDAGEFAGIDMKSGVLIIGGRSSGYLGANKRGGVIYARGANALPPSKEMPVLGEDVALLIRNLSVSQIHAMMFKKYV
jgi:formylmethanofuran dehydrogenase subunit C